VTAPTPTHRAMHNDTYDRRGLLRRFGLAAAAGSAVAVTGPLLSSETAGAATGDTVIAGGDNYAAWMTQLTSSDTDLPALVVRSGTGSGKGHVAALCGDGADADGVAGISGRGAGVFGYGRSGVGVAARSDASVAVSAFTTSSDPTLPAVDGYAVTGSGVRGESQHGIGVEGTTAVASGTGVRGTAQVAGAIGVVASAVAGGVALSVAGAAHFTRSGTVVIPAGRSSVVVPGVPLGATSMVLATIQQTSVGNSVSSAVPSPSASSITISLAKLALVNTRVAWFVVN
jgi:hypothetical protein